MMRWLEAASYMTVGYARGVIVTPTARDAESKSDTGQVRAGWKYELDGLREEAVANGWGRGY